MQSVPPCILKDSVLGSVSIMTGLWVIEMGNKNGNIRSIKRIEKALKEHGPLNTKQVIDALAAQKNHKGVPYKNQPTTQQIGNLLARHFKRCEIDDMTQQLLGGTYPLARWELKEEENEKTGPDN